MLWYEEDMSATHILSFMLMQMSSKVETFKTEVALFVLLCSPLWGLYSCISHASQSCNITVLLLRAAIAEEGKENVPAVPAVRPTP